MIARDKYLAKLIRNKNNGFPKVVTGIRRCGKSYLLSEIYRSYLLEQGVSKDCILLIDLDNDIYAKYRNLYIALCNAVEHSFLL